MSSNLSLSSSFCNRQTGRIRARPGKGKNPTLSCIKMDCQTTAETKRSIHLFMNNLAGFGLVCAQGTAWACECVCVWSICSRTRVRAVAIKGQQHGPILYSILQQQWLLYPRATAFDLKLTHLCWRYSRMSFGLETGSSFVTELHHYEHKLTTETCRY